MLLIVSIVTSAYNFFGSVLFVRKLNAQCVILFSALSAIFSVFILDIFMASTDIQYSKYYSELEGEAKSRYEQKMKMIGPVDPYRRLESCTTSNNSTVDWYEWPKVMYADIYDFLINATS